MLWVLKRTVSVRRSFWAPKTHAKNYGQENISIFTLKIFVYLNLSSDNKMSFSNSQNSASSKAPTRELLISSKHWATVLLAVSLM